MQLAPHPTLACNIRQAPEPVTPCCQAVYARNVVTQLSTDSFSRRVPAPKAWTSGTNPITQRGTTPVQQNGTQSQVKIQGISRTAAPKEQGITDRHAHDRLTFLLGAAFGSIVTINTKTGDKFEGIMSGSSQPPDSRVTLKMTKKQYSLQPGQSNGVAAGEAALVGTGPEHTMSFDSKNITEISISGLTPAETAKLPNGMMPTASNILRRLTICRCRFQVPNRHRHLTLPKSWRAPASALDS